MILILQILTALLLHYTIKKCVKHLRFYTKCFFGTFYRTYYYGCVLWKRKPILYLKKKEKQLENLKRN